MYMRVRIEKQSFALETVISRPSGSILATIHDWTQPRGMSRVRSIIERVGDGERRIGSTVLILETFSSLSARVSRQIVHRELEIASEVRPPLTPPSRSNDDDPSRERGKNHTFYSVSIIINSETGFILNCRPVSR